MKKFIKENWFKIAIILIALFAVILFFAYKDLELSQIRTEKENRAYRLNLCLTVTEGVSERVDCFKQFPQ